MRRDINLIETCFVRENKRCGRVLCGSKTAFIATPSADFVQLELDIIKSLLKNYDVEPYVAVEHRAFGKDIFCEKICGKIIESLFCIAILNDVERGNGIAIPNPNVYYEYGLMTALKKKIIPLQKADQKLAFNIQSLDTIKYTQRNFSSEIDSAIKSLIIEPEEAEKQDTDLVPQKVLIYLGLHGINWPQLIKNSDTEYFVLLGSGLGFFMLIDLINMSNCYLKILQGDTDEESINLHIKTLLHRLLPVRVNIERQIQELEPVLAAQMVHGQPLDRASITDETHRVNYLNNLLKYIDNARIYIYRPKFYDKSNILRLYNEIDIGMKLPELHLIDDDEIESFISK